MNPHKTHIRQDFKHEKLGVWIGLNAIMSS